MADSTISGLRSHNVPINNDLLVIVDVTAVETKKITVSDFYASPRAIGSINPSSGKFTTLQLSAGQVVNTITNDGTLANSSDTAIPTEQAVKEFVTNSISAFTTNSIYDGNSIVLVNDETPNIIVVVDSVSVASFETTGLILQTGVRINEFSSDETLGDNSDTAVPTEKAVRTYITNLITTDGTLSGNSDFVIPTEKAVKTYVDSLIIAYSSNQIINNNDYAIINRVGYIDFYINNMLVSAFSSDGLNLNYGTIVNEFSTDGTFTDNSDTAVPTEKAVKTYVDALKLYTDNEINELRDELSDHTRIYSGNSSVSVYDDSTSVSFVRVDIGSLPVLTITSDGLALKFGVSIESFSNDSTFAANSQVSVPTEYAVRTYIANQIALNNTRIQSGSQNLINGDSTATITLTHAKPHNFYSVTGCIMNGTDPVVSKYAFTIVNKQNGSFNVDFSSPIDSDNYWFNWVIVDFTI